MSFTAKFIIRYRHQAGHWANFDGAKYRIVAASGKVLKENLITSSAGETIVISTEKSEDVRVELFNLKTNTYDIPTFAVKNCTENTREKTSTKFVNVEKGYIQVKFTAPKAINLDKNLKYHFEFKPTGEKGIVTLSNRLKSGLTNTYTTEPSDLLDGGYPKQVKAKFTKLFTDVSPLARVHLKVVKKDSKESNEISTTFAPRVIPIGSKFHYREISLEKVFWEDKSEVAVKESKTIAQRLTEYRKVIVSISRSAGTTYQIERKDLGELIAPSLNPQNAITWQDGKEITIRIPKKFKGVLIIKNFKSKKTIAIINVAKFPNENDTISFGQSKFELPKPPSSGAKKLMEDAQKGITDAPQQKAEFLTYTISTNCNDQRFREKYALEDLKTCSDKEFAIIVNAIFTNFVWDNGIVPVFSAATTGARDAAKNAFRDDYINKYLIPFFKNIGVAAKDILIATKMQNKTLMILFLGLSHLRFKMNMNAIRHLKKTMFMNNIPVKEPITWKSIKTGAVIGFFIVATSEVIEHLTSDKANKDWTNLIGTLIGVGVKAIIGTILTTLVTAFILAPFFGAAAPFIAVLTVGLLVGFAIGFLLDSLDSYYLNFSGGIKYLLNRVQDSVTPSIKRLIESISKLVGVNYTIPNWLIN
ncbi:MULTISPECIES: hypothetical protein [unclassified Acinetobacter]|uniref:hypothetical protein n=1 Tax=unclassified Acinetobacter TaxID=196816 RepID=UPI0015D1BDDA|nr:MULTISPECIES: hypothetical protein [unclassified Acinetobacter]QOW48752.1 hypothetical protein G0029_02430 [Acinetobacter sp. YH12138]